MKLTIVGKLGVSWRYRSWYLL